MVVLFGFYAARRSADRTTIGWCDNNDIGASIVPGKNPGTVW
jgi:hypothetical protein